MIKSGQNVSDEFQTVDFDGNLQNADSLPTATLVVDGIDSVTSVTVSNKAVGIYKWSCTLPTLTAGQLVSVRVNATIDTVTTGNTVWRETADTLLPSEIPAATGVPVLYSPTAASREFGDNDGGDYTNLTAHDESNMVTGELSGASLIEGDLLTVTVVVGSSSLLEVPTVARVAGFYYGTSAHEISVYAYNYVAATYEKIGTMRTRTSAFDYVFPLDADQHDSGTGEMKLSFKHSMGVNGNASHYLSLDWVSFEKVDSNSQFASDIAFLVAQSIDIDNEVDNIEDLVAASAIQAACELALTAQGVPRISVASPVTPNGEITVYAGADYSAVDGQEISFTILASTVPDLTGATLPLAIGGDEWTASSCTSDGTNWTVLFEPDAEDTAAIPPKDYVYVMKAALSSGNIVPLSTGECHVLDLVP